jgi:hypothetical protein
MEIRFLIQYTNFNGSFQCIWNIIKLHFNLTQATVERKIQETRFTGDGMALHQTFC